MNWNVYSIVPIDMRWEHLPTVEDVAKQIAADDALAKARGCAQGSLDLDGFIARWSSAQDAARDAGWEGDFRNAPAVFWLPNEFEFEYGFVIKQDNNGTTFVVSPFPLPHLEDK